MVVPKVRLQALASRVRAHRKHLEDLRRRMRDEVRESEQERAMLRREG